jgi:hypothetical protein
LALPCQDVYPQLALYAAVAGFAFLLGPVTRLAFAGTDVGDRRGAWTRLGLVIVLGIDILAYQRGVHDKLPRLPPGDLRSSEMFSVSRQECLDVCTREPRSPRAVSSIARAPAGYPLALHTFLQWDSCALGRPEYDYLLLVPSGIHRLLSLRARQTPTWSAQP